MLTMESPVPIRVEGFYMLSKNFSSWFYHGIAVRLWASPLTFQELSSLPGKVRGHVVSDLISFLIFYPLTHYSNLEAAAKFLVTA